MSDVSFLQELYSLHESTAFEKFNPGTNTATGLTSRSSGGSGGGSNGNNGSSLWARAGDLTSTEEYNIAGNSWSSSAAGTQRQYGNYSSFDDLLVESVGEDSSNNPTDDVFLFTFSGETWAAGTADVGYDNSLAQGFGFERRLHTVGGSLSPSTQHRVYHITDDSYFAGTSISRNTSLGCGASISTRGYIIGGYDGGSTGYRENNVWNPNSDAWALSAADSSTTGRRLGHAASDLSNIYHRCGIEVPVSGSFDVNLNARYNVSGDSWTMLAITIMASAGGTGDPKNANYFGTIQMLSATQLEYIDSGAFPSNTGKIEVVFSLGHDFNSPSV